MRTFRDTVNRGCDDDRLRRQCIARRERQNASHAGPVANIHLRWNIFLSRDMFFFLDRQDRAVERKQDSQGQPNFQNAEHACARR